MKTDPYALHAPLYDRLYEPLARKLRAQGLKMAPPQENYSILDVGCGTGTQLALYRKPGCRLAGIDTSPAMLNIARRKLGDRAELYLEDAAGTRFADESFDLTTIVLVLHEMPGRLRPEVVKESLRVTKRSGRVMIMDYHFGPYPFPRGLFYKVLVTMMEISAGKEHYAHYRDFMRSHGLEGLAAGQHAAVKKKYIFESGVAAVYVLGP
jgi:ubiquinone/menaquinone biosynthesis C-methylase UbiE